MNPTTIENVESNFSYPGQFYYDRAGGVISYIPRSGETASDLEATATTAVVEELLVVKDVKNMKWEDVSFEYARKKSNKLYVLRFNRESRRGRTPPPFP